MAMTATQVPRPPTPAPRRVRMGPTAWMLVRELALADDDRIAHPDRLPTTPRRPEDEPAARTALVESGVLTADGELARPVVAGLRVLGSAPVTIVLDHRTAATDTRAAWGTLGTPTAGITVTDRHRGDGRADVEVELVLLTSDHLVHELLATLALPTTTDVTPTPAPTDATPTDARTSAPIDLLDAAIAGSLPAPLDGVVVDGRPVLQARLQLSGPAGTGLATIVGDGAHAWQLGATDRDTLTSRPVDATTVRRTLVSQLARQLHHLERAP